MFKSLIETLQLSGGNNFFVSKYMLGNKIALATQNEITAEEKKLKAISFILRSDENRYKKLLDDLKN